MKAAIALLADREAANYVRQLAWNVHCRYGISLDVARLPPHISLKQPFAIADLSALESFMGEFAASVPPVTARSPRLRIVRPIGMGEGTGILWLDVEGTELLRSLHLRLNHELAIRFGDVHADHDGADYRFHMTVAIGGQPWDTYERMYADIAIPSLDVCCVARELALFVYDDDFTLSSGYTTYKVLPLTGKA